MGTTDEWAGVPAREPTTAEPRRMDRPVRRA